MSTNKVAVYGSLRQGHGNNRILIDHGAKYVGTMTTKEKYAMYSYGGFPFVCKTKQVSPIVVEVYEVSDRCLKSLDWLEGYREESGRNFYDRSLTEMCDGTQALMYHIDNESDSHPLVSNGDWNEYCSMRLRKTVQ